MSKKLKKLSDLAKIKFNDLAPDPMKTNAPEPEFEKQHLEAHFSKKGRAGKVVTLIKGFEGDNESLKNLAKTLKKMVNTGGMVKKGEILIQGNYRDQIIDKLKELGHEVKRIGG